MDAALHRKRMSALETEASSWRTKWRRVGEQVRPWSVRFLSSDVDRAGDDKMGAIVNSTPAQASRTSSAGMMAGITSPARPWFRLGVDDAQAAGLQAVKEWLAAVEGKMREAFAKSNVYAGLRNTYSDLLDYGTALVMLDEDDEDYLRAYAFPCGSYFLAASDRREVDTFYRRTTFTVRELVMRFGRSAVSDSVRNAYDNGQLDTRHEVAHCVYANPEPGPESSWELNPTSRPWLSMWWEEKAGTLPHAFLRESGYREKPFFAPRWETTGEDVYGSSPGMLAVGDCEALQVLELRKAQMHEKIVNPPLAVPSDLASKRVSLLPGATNYLPGGSEKKIVPIHEVNPQAPSIAANDIAVHEARIRAAYFADLWLMLQQTEGQMTAREVVERREEKMLQLGPVLEMLQDELLEPLIIRTFHILTRRNQLPPPPEAIAGQPFKVEYISIMAQAQKLMGLTAIDRTATFVANLVATFPSAAEKLDVDETIDVYAESTGVPPGIIRGADEVAKLRESKAKMQKQQMAVEQAGAAAQTAKTLADTDTSSQNALTEMLRGVGAR